MNFDLPSPRTGAVADPAHAASTHPRAATPPPERARILLVDDVAANVALLRQILLHAGYPRVDTTTDPRDAARLHRDHRYHLVILALKMQPLSGLEVLPTLAAADPSGFVPAILIAPDPADRLRALDAGAVDCFYDPIQVPEFLARVAHTIAGDLRHRDLDLRHRALERDLAAAIELCAARHPEPAPACAGYEVAASTRSAGHTSGDVYDLARAPSGDLILLVADATGHGLGPAITARQVRAMVRVGLSLGGALERVVAAANDLLSVDLPPDRFVTAFLGALDPTAHTVRYVAPGQGPLLHWRAATGTAAWRTATCPPLGIAAPPFAAHTVHLDPGDVLLVATDGVFERADEAGRMFGEAGVVRVLREAGRAGAESILRRLTLGVDRFAGSAMAHDDATVLVLKRADLG